MATIHTTDPSAVTVEAVIERGIVGCDPGTPLTDVAALMADRRIHCVVVSGLARTRGGGERLVWGVVSDLDVAAAAVGAEPAATAGDVAGTEVVTVAPDRSVAEAARLMVEHDTSHLVVVDGGVPVGVISTLDVAGVVAGVVAGTA